MSWQAYIDDSRSDDLDTYVLAGYIGKEQAWAEFSKEWKDMLRALPSFMDAFKMSRMMLSEEGREKSLWFYRIIEKHDLFGISCTFKISDLAQAVDSISWPENFRGVEDLKNPYYFGFKAIIDVLSQYQKKMGINECVDFIFDEQSEKERLRGTWKSFKEASASEFRMVMGNEPIHLDDKKTFPLQAADLFAWLVRHWEEEGVDWINNPIFPWSGEVKAMKGLSMKFSKDDLAFELSKGLDNPAALARAKAL